MIATYSGKIIDPYNVNPDDITIKDIAHGLSLLCRYSGQCSHFYSVAEHSIIMANSDFLKGTPKAKLLHDAGEAYINDLLRAVKQHLPEYKVIENNFLAAIGNKYGVTQEEFNEVKEADRIMLSTEALHMMPANVGYLFNVAPTEHKLFFWYLTPKEAEDNFKIVANKLGVIE